MKIKMKRLVSLILAAGITASTIAGCDFYKEEVSSKSIPKLLDPVSDYENYRPVKRQSIFDSKINIAKVVGEEHCYFLKTATPIREICVDLGEYVHKGDVLAKMDVDELVLMRDKKSVELECQTKKLSMNASKNQSIVNYKNLDYEIKKKTFDKLTQEVCETYGYYRENPELEIDSDSEYLMNYGKEKAKEAMENSKTELDIALENAKFDDMLCIHKMEILSEEIERLNEKIEKGSIVAENEGYVTYLRNISKGKEVAGFENIVIITDESKVHLEIEEKVNSKFDEQCKLRCRENLVLMGDKETPVERTKYTNSEYHAMESADFYPNISFDISEEILNTYDIEVGDSIPVRTVFSGVDNVLAVGNDSLFLDEKGSFVYVRTDNGKEKREVVTGHAGNNYTEIVNGLNEGEFVFCLVKTLPPSEYTTYEAKRELFSPKNAMSLKPILEYTKSFSYVQKREAKVEEINVKNGDIVSIGDILCTLLVTDGKSDLKKKENAVFDIESEKNARIIAARQAIGDIEKVLNEEKDEDNKKLLNANIDMINSILESENIEGDFKKKLAELDLEHVSKELNGDGRRVIKAEKSGKIDNVSISEGKTICSEKNSNRKTEQELMTILDAGSFKIGTVSQTGLISVGTTVYFKNTEKSTDVFCGSVIGNSANENKAYVSHIGERSYITKSRNSEREESFININSDENIDFSKYGIYYSQNEIKNLVVLPQSAVFDEIREGESSVTYHYVWKLINGEIVKSYVETDDRINADIACIFDGVDEGETVLCPK